VEIPNLLKAYVNYMKICTSLQEDSCVEEATNVFERNP
jgi:hypothetical protein